MRRGPEAEPTLRQCFDILEQMAAEFPDQAQVRAELGHGYRYFSGWLWRQARVPENEPVLRKALAIFEKLSADDPGSHSHRHYLADTWRYLGQVLSITNRLQEAEQAFRSAVRIFEECEAEFSGRIIGESEVAAAYACLASAVAADGRLQEAKDIYQRAMEILPAHAELHNVIAWNLATWPKLPRRHPVWAVELAKKAVELAPEEGRCWTSLGAAHYRASDWKAAIQALDKSLQLRKGGDSLDCFFLAMAHWQLRDKEQARTWYDRAIERMQQDQLQNEELRRFRAEAAELLGIKK